MKNHYFQAAENNRLSAILTVINFVFGVYLLSIDLVSAFLLLGLTIGIVVVYGIIHSRKFLYVAGYEIEIEVFEKFLHLIPAHIRVKDLDNRTIMRNHSPYNIHSTELTILKESQLQSVDAKIVTAQDDKGAIHHILTFKSEITDKNNQTGAYFCIDLMLNEILKYANDMQLKNEHGADNSANQSESNGILQQAFRHISDGVAVFKVDSDKNTECIIANPAFSALIAPHTTQDGLLELFDISDRERVETILNYLGDESIYFEALMSNESDKFPAEIHANSVKMGSEYLVNLSVRDVSSRKEHDKKRVRNRILRLKTNEHLQKIHILYLALSKINEQMDEVERTINDAIGRHNELEGELQAILQLNSRIITRINEIINFYSPTGLKSLVNIQELIRTMQTTIFTPLMLNHTTISVTQKGRIREIYCDEDALKVVLLAILGNAVENINIARGSNFYGKIQIVIDDLSSGALLLSIEDNGGGASNEMLGRCFDAFYSSHNNKTGIGLSAAKILIEDTLYGEIMAMNANDGFRVEITLPVK